MQIPLGILLSNFPCVEMDKTKSLDGDISHLDMDLNSTVVDRYSHR